MDKIQILIHFLGDVLFFFYVVAKIVFLLSYDVLLTMFVFVLRYVVKIIIFCLEYHLYYDYYYYVQISPILGWLYEYYISAIIEWSLPDYYFFEIIRKFFLYLVYIIFCIAEAILTYFHFMSKFIPFIRSLLEAILRQ
jgi:hypothetical protein